MFSAEHSLPMVTFPGVRERRPTPIRSGFEKYKNYETTAGYVTLGDANGDIIGFSGLPENIEIFVLDNDAIFQYIDRTGAADDEVTINANNFYSPRLTARTIRGRNATAGLNARVQVVAKWD